VKRTRMFDYLGSSRSFPNEKERLPVRRTPPYTIEPVFEHFTALLPERNAWTIRSAASAPYPRRGDLRETGSGVRLRIP